MAPYSHHAQSRMQQRGIGAELVQLVLEYGDGSRDVGDGCRSVYIERSQILDLLRIGIRPELLARACRVAVIEASDGTIITVINRETRFSRFNRGHARLSCRQRACMAARRQRRRAHSPTSHGGGRASSWDGRWPLRSH